MLMSKLRANSSRQVMSGFENLLALLIFGGYLDLFFLTVFLPFSEAAVHKCSTK